MEHKFNAESVRLHDVQELLSLHNLVNAVNHQLEVQKLQYH